MKYDLIVVGAGVLGAFHAYHAAKLGKNVLLLEKDFRQKGSSTQNFGQVVPSGLSSKWNIYGQRSIQIYSELQQISDFTIRQNGSVYIASDADELGLLEEISKIHTLNGYSNTLLTKKEVINRFPDIKNNYVKGGIFYAKEVSVNPSEMVNRLTNFLNETGKVHVRYEKPVIEILEKSSGCIVKTSNKFEYAGERVMVCCGYTFNLLYPEVFKESGITLSKLQMLRTKPLPNFKLKSNILTGLTIRRYESFEECPSFKSLKTPEKYLELQEKGIHILFKQADDGSIIIGDSHEYARANGLEELGNESKKEIDDLIMAEARNILALPENCISERWAGFYGQHSKDIFIHDIDRHIRIITGIGGKGMTSSAGFAEESIRNLYQA